MQIKFCFWVSACVPYTLSVSVLLVLVSVGDGCGCVIVVIFLHSPSFRFPFSLAFPSHYWERGRGKEGGNNNDTWRSGKYTEGEGKQHQEKAIKERDNIYPSMNPGKKK